MLIKLTHKGQEAEAEVDFGETLESLKSSLGERYCVDAIYKVVSERAKHRMKYLLGKGQTPEAVMGLMTVWNPLDAPSGRKKTRIDKMVSDYLSLDQDDRVEFLRAVKDETR